MTTKYDNLRLNCLTAEHHRKTCGYWYTVTTPYYAHTAFATRRGLYQWLTERGLKLTQPLPVRRGTAGGCAIAGAYIENLSMCGTQGSWDSLPGVFAVGRGLQNGDYVETKFTMAEDGVTIIEHKLNPNCRWRKTFDYAESSERQHDPDNGRDIDWTT